MPQLHKVSDTFCEMDFFLLVAIDDLDGTLPFSFLLAGLASASILFRVIVLMEAAAVVLEGVELFVAFAAAALAFERVLIVDAPEKQKMSGWGWWSGREKPSPS